MSQEIGQDWDKVIIIPLWRYYKPTSSVKVPKGTHEERHEPSQTVRVIEDCRIIFFTRTLEKNITEPIQRSSSFIPFPSLKLRCSDSFLSIKTEKKNSSSSVWLITCCRKVEPILQIKLMRQLGQ